MQLFYAPNFTPPLYTLDQEESKHAIRVLRMQLGEALHITDGRGNLFHCRITDANPKRCSVEVVETHAEHGKLPYTLTIAISPPKSIERYEWFLEKATEVGISEIVTLRSEHSERKMIKYERELRVITSAVKQSLKCYHPLLRDTTPFMEFISQPFEGQKFIAHCAEASTEEGKPHLTTILHPNKPTLILIGPEGDFSETEIATAISYGFKEINLGTQRLRSETAAVVATVIAATANIEACLNSNK